ncbi:T9SS type A sorting domain-containing protein [Flavobacterium aquicola]|uniref:Putative secreted protein (Por secretion system target) n=1 Tax=Flavobacterium aquicola TaxID=1682742 RepID=A0A3E0E459_9FLAO|nr:T9SS type A sorting domain-containing protein [Flavobacterium aquicola]REG92975.1 putative secreted protein (Por secretion system target) [Flavobacterium aquicola]
MKKIIFILFVILSTLYGSQINAQTVPAPNWAWAANITGASAVAATDDGSIFTDAAGNSYVVNQISSHVNIKKYDAAGTLIWDRTGSSGAGVETPTDITVDATGNYYVTGSHTGSSTFGTTILPNTAQIDLFVVKYNSSGTVVWASNYGVSRNNQGNSIAVDSNGNCFVGGYMCGNATTAAYFFYAKYDSNGVIQWSKYDGYPNTTSPAIFNVVNGVSVDNFGNSYLTGYYRPNGSTQQLFFIRKCDPFGNTVWHKTRTENSAGFDIVTDKVGNSYVTGAYYTGTSWDIFTRKYDAAGQILWAQNNGGVDADYGDGIAIDADGNCYVSGRFQQNAAFGPIAISNLNSGVSDVFVAKYDKLGDVVWVQQAGESGEDAASKIGVDAANNVYINGYFTTSTTFGTAALNGIVRQPYIAKIGDFVEGTESITTLPLASHNYNAGSSISVPFSTKGNFPAGTKYTVELSDPSGSFFYPKYIGVGTASPINCVIPSLTIPAAEYRIRVISTTPEVFGTDNGSAITINGNSQLTTPDWAWAKNIDGVSSVATTDDGSIFTDAGGNSYVVNQISSHVNIKKYDAAGTLVWDRTGSSGSGVENPTDITVDASGNYYITGSYTGSATFGAITLANTGQSDLFIIKYDASGTVLWASNYNLGRKNQGNSIAVDSNGNCYVGGYMYGNATTYSYYFYAKYDSNGVVQWSKYDGYATNTTLLENTVNGISVDNFGNSYITGYTRTSSATGNYFFIRKCDPSGGEVWTKRRTEYSIGNDIVTDKVGNSYVTGAYYTGSSWDIFIRKYDAAGQLPETVEQKGIGLDADYGDGIALDANGNYFVTGRFQHNTDFSTLNVSNTSSGISDVFVAKYDNQGNIVWLQQVGESGQDAGSKIGVDAAGNCYINGYYTASATFGTATLNGLTRNPFLAKIGLTADTTLGTAVVKGENFCGGAVVTVDFAITGKYDAANIFTAQLSDASGSFSSPVNIGTLESPLNTSIYAIIPLAAPAGTGYRIRVVSSNTPLIGSDNGIDIKINQTDCKSNIVKLDVKPIAAIEYFIDTDPGLGKGTPLPTAGGLNVSENLQITLPTLTSGFHNLFIRTKDIDGKWGMYEGRVFYVQPEPLVLTSSPIVAGEYFFDTEPGIGNGTALAPFSAATPLSVTAQVSTTGLSEGFHNLFFRTKDSKGQWSMYEGRVVYIQPTVVSTVIEPIVTAEYYFDTDPGLGSGTAIDIGTPAESITVTLSDVATSTLGAGDHNVFVRVKNEGKVWSLTEKRTFTICSVLLTAPVISGNPVVCAGQGLSLTAETVVGAASYLWTGPNGFTAATQSITINNLASYQTGEYTVIAVSGTGPCGTGPASKITVSISTTPVPTAVVATQTFCNAGTVSELKADGTDIKWYTQPANGTSLDGTAALSNGIWYYASQTLNSCESISRLPILASMNVTPVPAGTATQTFCNAAKVSELKATGSDVKWYADPVNGTSLNSDAALANNTWYYASQTLNSCESAARLAVLVSINVTPTPTGTATQTFCNAAKISELQATGSDIKWYTDSVNGTSLNSDEALVNNTLYYASQTLNSCESAARLAVMASINVTPAPSGDTNQTLEENKTIADIVVTGTDIKWYDSQAAAAAGTNPLDLGLALEEGKTYYATQTIDSCFSTSALGVTIGLTLGNDSFDSKSFAYFPNHVKDNLNLSHVVILTKVRVLNMLGQELISKNLNATSGTVDMSSIADGYYLIEVNTEDASKIFKVIKSNK